MNKPLPWFVYPIAITQIIAIILVMAGCTPEMANTYHMKVEMAKQNSQVVSVTVNFYTETRYLTNKQQIENLKSQLSSVIKDLEYAQEQMVDPVPRKVTP